LKIRGVAPNLVFQKKVFGISELSTELFIITRVASLRRAVLSCTRFGKRGMPLIELSRGML